MENQAINQYVRNSKSRFKKLIVRYLKWQVRNCYLAKQHPNLIPKDKINVLNKLFQTRCEALKDIQNLSEKNYTHNDWGQCMNITSLYYISRDDKIKAKVAKAHFDYCCRYYLKTMPASKHDDGLEIIHKLSQWNQAHASQIKLATPFR